MICCTLQLIDAFALQLCHILANQTVDPGSVINLLGLILIGSGITFQMFSRFCYKDNNSHFSLKGIEARSQNRIIYKCYNHKSNLRKFFENFPCDNDSI